MIGRSTCLTISRIISSLNARVWVEVPISTVGLTALTTDNQLLTHSDPLVDSIRNKTNSPSSSLRAFCSGFSLGQSLTSSSGLA